MRPESSVALIHGCGCSSILGLYRRKCNTSTDAMHFRPNILAISLPANNESLLSAFAGNSGLHYAAGYGRKELLEYLLKARLVGVFVCFFRRREMLERWNWSPCLQVSSRSLFQISNLGWFVAT